MSDFFMMKILEQGAWLKSGKPRAGVCNRNALDGFDHAFWQKSDRSHNLSL